MIPSISKKIAFTFFFSAAVIFTVFVPFAEGQIDQANFTRILSENGLSQNTVHCILQDSKGFMWFATEDGLDEYDGYSFTVYKNIPHDSNSISDNFIWTIFEDDDGTLWIGTNSGGLCRFDREYEKFTTYKNDPHNPNSLVMNNVRTVCKDNDGNIWIGTENGLDKLNTKTGTFTHFKHNANDSNSISDNVVLTLSMGNNNQLWIGSNGGLDRLDISGNKVYHVKLRDKPSANPNSGVVLSICRDNKNNIWLGTLNGLVKYDESSGENYRFLLTTKTSGATNINRINSIILDKRNLLWVGTGAGLYRLNLIHNQFSKHLNSIMDSAVLDNNNILSLYEDNSNLLWVGTAEDGIVKYDRERIKFRNFMHNPLDPNSLSYNTIRAVLKDNNGVLWVGTLGSGLNRLDPGSGKFFHYKNDPGNKFSLSDNSISAICEDNNSYLWIGTWGGGLNRTISPISVSNIAQLKFIRFKNIRSDSQSVSDNIIQAIYEDSENRIWIGTGNGLDLYDRVHNRFINFTNDPKNPNSISNNLIQSCILEDMNKNIWIGTWNGLNKISSSDLKDVFTNPGSVKFQHFVFENTNPNGLSDNRIISIFQDEEGNLWFGTYGGGLNMFPLDQQKVLKPKFINYTTGNDLPSNIIYSIQGDDEGNIWVSTDNGLSMFNPRTKIFRNYDATDGLQGNQFYWGAGFKGNNDELFFGGTNGLNAFYPEELNDNKHIPPVYITDFQIFNKPVNINNPDAPVHKSILFTKEITLSYSQNVFSFEFAALDYTAPSKNRYAYIMEGFDKEWNYSGRRRFVTYTNLDPGQYTFRVIGSNNDGIWNKVGSSIVIKILPPIWRTWWFILSVVILIVGIIAAIIYSRVKHLLEIERFRTKLAADLHDNIGSSLTEISILSEVISQKIQSVDESIKKSLSMISNSSRNLIDNMSDIVWLVNPKRDSLYDLILRLRDTYSELSSYTNISFRSENIKSLEKISLTMEHRQHLYLIFKEAINNSITHSCCTEIILDASVKGKLLQMTLKDNGRGFPVNGQFSGNGLNNIKVRAQNIGGILNIYSQLGEGTTIQFEGNIL
jgi:ligand-binding sensor domain-containing protein/two-component sensor histidine kinase